LKWYRNITTKAKQQQSKIARIKGEGEKWQIQGSHNESMRRKRKEHKKKVKMEK